jgi:PAS domain S-box-containing protein
MFTAMSVLRLSLEGIADGHPGAPSMRLALGRILDLELAIMLETYRDDFIARLQRIERHEKQQLEQALARSEHRYVHAVELAGAMVVGLDADGQIVLFNREAERVTGRARDEAFGWSFVELFLPEEDRAAGHARLAAVAADPTAQQAWECEIVTRSGRRRSVALRLSHGAEDDVVVFAVGSDVTDERALQQRMMQTEKLAAIGTLAAGLAHEIRNPLNGALLHVTFLDRALARQGASRDALDAVNLVGDEIRRLSALVKDFLVFARPSTPTLAPLSLRTIAERIVGLLEADARAARASFVSDLGTASPIVDGDAAKLEQALLNLVKNALEAVAETPGGRVVVRLRRRPRHALL